MSGAGFLHVAINGEAIDLALLAEVVVQQKLNAHWTAQVIFRSTHDTQPDVSEMLGQTLKVSGYDLLGVEHNLFTGPVKDVELIYEVNGSYGARIVAISQSWLMDQSSRHAYFLKQSPSDIAQTLAGSYGLTFKGSIEGESDLSRVQWSESDWSFLLRLVDDGEAWLRPTEDGLETQTSFQSGPTLLWREGEYGLLEFSGAAKVRPVLQGGAHYDHRAAQSQTYSGITSEASYYDPWSGLRSKTLAAGQSLPAATVTERHRATTLDSYQQLLQKESRRQAVNAHLCTGISRSPEVMAGNEVTISGLDQDADGTYGVIECLHHWTPRGYENHFRATTAKRWFAPERIARPDAEGVFPARVVANHDPANLGRVQVQFYWQEENATTWARLITAHAGAGRGTLLLPEIGDEVAVRFEAADPERPYILGSVWNGVLQPPTDGFWEGGTNGGEFAGNNIKRLVTRSGHRITLVDTAGQETIAMATPKSNRLLMTEKTNETGRPAVVLHTDGDIILSAPNGRIHLQSKLQSKEVGSAGGAATAVAPPSPAALTGSCTDKMARAISRAPLAKGVLDALGGPTGIAVAIASMVGVAAVAQLTPAGWAADVAGALAMIGLALSGSEIVHGLKGLYDFWQFTCKQAKTEADLDHAGKMFANSVAQVGVNTLLAILDAKALGRLKGARPPAEEETPTSRYKTPDATVLANTDINGIKPVRVRPGTNGKVAVIGRSMNDAVNPYASGLAEQGYDVETFSGDHISEFAKTKWRDLAKNYPDGIIPDDVIPSTPMYQENEAWVQKLASQEYTVVDTGNPTSKAPSVFYNMEQQVLFGGK